MTAYFGKGTKVIYMTTWNVQEREVVFSPTREVIEDELTRRAFLVKVVAIFQFNTNVAMASISARTGHKSLYALPHTWCIMPCIH